MQSNQADLQRTGYVLDSILGDSSIGEMSQRSYSYHGQQGSSMTLTDSEYPASLGNRRELVFDIAFTVNEGRFPTDISAITPKLIEAAQKAVRENPAVAAGLAYVAIAADSGVSREALQAAVNDYVQHYRQPKTPLHEDCAGCGSVMGFGDRYAGGPDLHKALNIGGSDWKIAGIRHYLNGQSVFTVELTAKIPRRS